MLIRRQTQNASKGSKEKIMTVTKQYTNNTVERITIGSWLGLFISTIIIIIYMWFNNPNQLWLPTAGLISEIIGFITFLFTDAKSGLKKALAGFAVLAFVVTGYEAINRLLGTIFEYVVLIDKWITILLAAQPDAKAITIASLGLEAFLAITAACFGYFVLYRYFMSDKKLAITLSFLIHALIREEVIVFIIALIMTQTLHLLIKNVAKVATKEATKTAKSRNQWTLFTLISGLSLISIGLFFSQAMTWMTGLIVIFSDHPFTALSFIAQGSLVGKWYATKTKK
jgi:hypothetical protein